MRSREGAGVTGVAMLVALLGACTGEADATLVAFDGETGAVAWVRHPDGARYEVGAVYAGAIHGRSNDACGDTLAPHAFRTADGADAPARPWTEVAVGGGLALASWPGDRIAGTMTIDAVDATTGAARWSITGPDRIAGATAEVAATRWYDRTRQALTVNARELADGAVRWTRELPDLSDAQVVDGQVVATGRVIMQEGSLATLVAVDAATGAPQWRYDDPDPRGAALVVGDRVIVTSGPLVGAAAMTALDAATGQQAWRVDLPGEAPWPMVATAGVIAVLVARDVDREVVAIDAATGAIVWRRVDPLWSLVGDAGQVCGSRDPRTVICLDAHTGAERWTASLAADVRWIHQVLVAAGQVVAVGSSEVGGSDCP